MDANSNISIMQKFQIRCTAALTVNGPAIKRAITRLPVTGILPFIARVNTSMLKLTELSKIGPGLDLS
jgi:hypothetical protein